MSMSNVLVTNQLNALLKHMPIQILMMPDIMVNKLLLITLFICINIGIKIKHLYMELHMDHGYFKVTAQQAKDLVSIVIMLVNGVVLDHIPVDNKYYFKVNYILPYHG